MLDFGYDLIHGVFQDIWKANALTWTLTGIKTLAMAIWVLNLYSDMLTSRYDWGVKSIPITKQKLLSSIIMFLILISYNHIIDLMDNLLGKLDETIINYNPTKHVFQKRVEAMAGTEDVKITDYIKLVLAEAYKRMTNPMTFVQDLLYQILYIIDNIIYGIFLVERFFAITLLKLSAPIIFAMAIFEKFRNLFYKWIALYVSYYFLVIGFFLVIYIANEIYGKITGQITANPQLLLASGITTNVALCLSVWIKYRLFKKSNDLIYKIFSM